MTAKRVGEITHFYDRISVAVIDCTDSIRLGDSLHIFGRLTDLHQKVTSMEIEHEKVDEVGPGQEFALKVDRPVRRGDKVFRLVDEEVAEK